MLTFKVRFFDILSNVILYFNVHISSSNVNTSKVIMYLLSAGALTKKKHLVQHTTPFGHRLESELPHCRLVCVCIIISINFITSAEDNLFRFLWKLDHFER